MSAETLAQAKKLLSQQAVREAEKLLVQITAQPTNAQTAEAFGLLGAISFQVNEFLKAADYFQRVTELQPEAHRLFFDQAYAAERGGDTPRALVAYREACKLAPAQGRYYLYFGCALHAAGRQNDALMVWSAGSDVDPMVRQAQFHPKADADLRARSALADRNLTQHLSELHRQSVPDNLPRVANAVWIQTHDVPFKFKQERQQPTMFYLPDLPAHAIVERTKLDWAATLEAATDAIRAEYLASASPDLGAPYIPAAKMQGAQWDKLRGSSDWQAIHLFKEGIKQPEAAGFPATLEALETVPTVKLGGTPLEVFFSVLAPNTDIPPHYGLANSRLTVHLPLIVPDACSLRVGDHTHAWAEGEVLAFDDSFEHEARNGSDQPRVVLIFEAWMPELSGEERAAIENSFAARDAWYKARQLPL